MCYVARNVFTKLEKKIIHQYVQPCLSKNPKYTFYTIKRSLTLAYNISNNIFGAKRCEVITV